MNSRGDALTFVVPGDLHLTEPGLENHRVALRVIDEVNALIRPDFVQFIGDNVQDATEGQFRLFDDLRRRLVCPHFALVGDHDVNGDPKARGFRARFGTTFGSSSLRGFRLLRLDTQQSSPMGLSAEQVDWLRREVDAAAAGGERAVIFQHNYPYQIWEDFAGPGVDEWRAVVQSRPIQAIVCGHTHYLQFANDGRNVVVAARSIGDPEGGPPGYLIGHLRGEELAFVYRSPGEGGPIVLVTHPREALLATGPAHVVSGADEVRVRIWSASPVAEVRGRIDGGDWFLLGPREGGEWSGPVPGGELEKGEHALAIEATDREGGRGTHRGDFAVDPTGRYTAVPAVRPRVTSTAFC